MMVEMPSVNNMLEEGSEFVVIENDNNIEDEYKDTEKGDDDDEGDRIEEMIEGVDDHYAKEPLLFLVHD